MEAPKMFTGIKDVPAKATTKFYWPSFIGKLVAAVVAITILLYVGFQLFGFATRIATNWNEIAFAYNKPAVVHTVRVQYENKAVALDNQFTNGKADEQTAVLKHLETVLNKTSSK